MKKTVMYVMLTVVLAVISATGFYFYFSQQNSSASAVENIKNYNLGTFTVNVVGDDTQRTRYIKTEIVFSSFYEGVQSKLDKRKPQIRDAVITILRKHSATLTVERDFTEIKKEIKVKIDEYLGDVVDEIYITKFVAT